jgi:hypothetical protein
MYIAVLWDLDDDVKGNVQHGLTKDDVEHALANAWHEDVSESSGLPLIFGPACDQRVIVVVFEQIDETRVYPVTAYQPEPE